MMLQAIVYTSQSGFTQKYAQLLGARTHLPVYSLKESTKKLPRKSSVLYLGWLMAGSVKGLPKALRRYDVRGICAVGMGTPGPAVTEETRRRHHTGDIAVFSLQGGFDLSRLHGIYRFMMQSMGKAITRKLSAKPDRTPEENAMLKLYTEGGDFVSEQALIPVMKWMETQ